MGKNHLAVAVLLALAGLPGCSGGEDAPAGSGSVADPGPTSDSGDAASGSLDAPGEGDSGAGPSDALTEPDLDATPADAPVGPGDAAAPLDALGSTDGSGGDVPGDEGATTPAPCTVFPADNWWNLDISGYPVHPSSDMFVASIGAGKPLHPDFGTVWGGAPNGIPSFEVAPGQPMVPIDFSAGYAGESDPGPCPIPLDAPIEGGPDGTGDRHVIAFDPQACRLYELFAAYPQPVGGFWKAMSGAVFDLTSNELRPIGWTSADAAGLPIFAGLVRIEEVESGVIDHALRFTVSKTRRAFVLPATHWASSSTDPALPPMGLRFRLRGDFDVSGFSARNQVILKALKKHGMFVADNGGDWFISGSPNMGWDDDDLHKLKTVKGADFEAVDTGPIHTTYDID